VSGINYFGIQLSAGDHSERLTTAISRVKALMFSVDGVLTGGQITFDGSGEEICSCYGRDALAIRAAQESGLQIAAFSARQSNALRSLLEEIGIRNAFLGCSNTMEAYEAFTSSCGLEDDECAYIADDVGDIPILEKVALSVTPIDGIEYLRNRVSYISGFEGGKGCVREMIELILQQQGKWTFSDHCVL